MICRSRGDEEFTNIVRTHLIKDLDATEKYSLLILDYLEKYCRSNKTTSVDEKYMYDILIDNYGRALDNITRLMLTETNVSQIKIWNTYISELKAVISYLVQRDL